MEQKQIQILGYKKCPKLLHKKYREAVNFMCQRCMQEEKECGKLIPHRITRGNKGGLYTLVPLNHSDNNVKVVCLDCHKLFHANDNRRVKSN